MHANNRNLESTEMYEKARKSLLLFGVFFSSIVFSMQ